MKTKKPLRILIVDDDPLLCWFWQKTLETRYLKNVRVMTYTNPHEALEKLDPGISLILLDWHMPHLNGKEFLVKAREKGVGPEKIILFSGTPAKILHKEFNFGECLAVIEKGAPDQETVLVKILDELIKKSG